MKNKELFFLCLLFCAIHSIRSQGTNLARIEYAHIPQSKSDNVYKRVRISGNYPIKINNEGTYLVIAVDYRYNDLKIEDDLPIDNLEGVNAFQTFGLEIGYTYKMKNNWRFGAKLGSRISSDFEGSGLGKDDFGFIGSLYFVKSYKEKNDPKMSRLIVGLRYATPASISFPLPIINYFKKFHPNWSYTLGTPKTSVKYLINKKNTLQAFVSLDRFYGNLQNNRAFVDQNGNTKVAENISMLNIIGALGYEYYFTEHLLFYLYTGYTLSNEIRLRNDDQENILNINDSNTLYFRSGIKLKI